MKFNKKLILKKLEEDKDVLKAISKESYYEVDNFIKDCGDYVKAIRERRMMCVIHSVSSSGMSRVISFHSCEKGKDAYWYRQYICLFEILGIGSEIKQSGHFRIHGCGMDMIFHTNYTIIHILKRLGFISDEECRKLAQETPTVF